MSTKAKFCNFDCWCEHGPENNFLLHIKSTRTDGSFEHFCHSFDSVDEAFRFSKEYQNKTRAALIADGLTITGDYEWDNRPAEEKE